MNVLVIGANGNTGKRVVQKLKDHVAHEPLAMIRDASQQPTFAGMGVQTVIGDLEHPIDHAFEGCDAVIFAAGSGPKTGKDKTVLIDQLGGIRAAVAALNTGTKRFVMLSGLHVDRDAEGDPIPHWRRAKGRADDFIRTMDKAFDGEKLDETIVCPGGLTDDGPTDAIQIVDPHASGKTSRDNLAATMVACLDTPQTIGQTFGVINGDRRVSDAVAAIP